MYVSVKGDTFQKTEALDGCDSGYVEELYLIFQGFLLENFLGCIICTVPFVIVTLTFTTNNMHKSIICHAHKHLINLLWRKETTLLGNSLTQRERKKVFLSIHTSLLVLQHINSGSTRGDARVNAYGTCLERYLNRHRCAVTATWNINTFQAEISQSVNSQHYRTYRKAFTQD